MCGTLSAPVHTVFASSSAGTQAVQHELAGVNGNGQCKSYKFNKHTECNSSRIAMQLIYTFKLNPLPTNEVHVASWTLRKPIGIYMGDL